VSKRQQRLEQQLADAVSETYADALAFVMLAFPWDSDPAIQVVDWESEDILVDPVTGFCYDRDDEPRDDRKLVTYREWMAPYRKRFNSRYGPDRWACEALDAISKDVRERKFDGKRSVAAIQAATASGHGIGKSVLVAWLILWIMSTRPWAKGTVTANTSEQLRTKTWAELGKWHRRCITGHWFLYNSGRGSMSLRHKDHGNEWYCTAQTCREENSEAFAGQHAANSTSFYIFDEGSGVPNKIYEVREGGTTDGEPMVFDFGNPTRNSGRFFEECEGKLRHRFRVMQIDSRTVVITNKKRIREWIEDFGEDSDFVRVRVRGEFPSQGSLQFISSSWVRRAMIRPTPPEDRYAPVKIGVDVARFGDDNSVIYPVVGDDARSFAPKLHDGIWHGLDTVALANKVIDKIEFFRRMGCEPSVFVDVTGIGAGVCDVLRDAGYPVTEVNFGTTPVFEPERYRFRSDEMWGRMKEAVKTRLVLPPIPELRLVSDDYGQVSIEDEDGRSCANRLFSDLTQREFGYTIQGAKVHLETKKDMKSRGVDSPDVADALALAHAQDVARAAQPHGAQGRPLVTEHDFDPTAGVSVA